MPNDPTERSVIGSTVEDDNQACMTGRLMDFLVYLDVGGYLAVYDAEPGQPPALSTDNPVHDNDRRLEVATDYVTGAMDAESGLEAPEWVNARNYGRRETVFTKDQVLHFLRWYNEQTGGGGYLEATESENEQAFDDWFDGFEPAQDEPEIIPNQS